MTWVSRTRFWKNVEVRFLVGQALGSERVNTWGLGPDFG